MKKCEYCGNKITEDVAVCPHCGAVVGGQQNTENATENKAEEKQYENANRKGKTVVILAAIMIIAIFVLFIIMAINIFKRGNDIYKNATQNLGEKISVSYFDKE
ncbi:MAG: zinc-ribbon domain-containing protein [Clostridia bacterium]|nr:zinc-ribbon domain-containing protein [Clostridia bacterium]